MGDPAQGAVLAGIAFAEDRGPGLVLLGRLHIQHLEQHFGIARGAPGKAGGEDPLGAGLAPGLEGGGLGGGREVVADHGEGTGFLQILEQDLLKLTGDGILRQSGQLRERHGDAQLGPRVRGEHHFLIGGGLGPEDRCRCEP